LKKLIPGGMVLYSDIKRYREFSDELLDMVANTVSIGSALQENDTLPKLLFLGSTCKMEDAKSSLA
jgi:hypothetical protein